jgi:hypothetical protein
MSGSDCLLWCFGKCVKSVDEKRCATVSARIACCSNLTNPCCSRNKIVTTLRLPPTPTSLSLHSRLHVAGRLHSFRFEIGRPSVLEERSTFTSGCWIADCSFLSGINLYIFVVCPFRDSTRRNLWRNCVQNIVTAVFHAAGGWSRLWANEVNCGTRLFVCCF